MAKDDRLSGARNLGTLNGGRTFRDSVGLKDKSDYYAFSLSGRSSFNLLLNKLRSNVDVSLIQAGRVLFNSKKGGRKSESIATTLDAGTYYLRVYPKGGGCKYKLKIETTLLPLPMLPQVSRRFLALFSSNNSPTVGSINTTNGVFSALPNSSITLTDIASYTDNDLFGITYNSLYRIDPNVGNFSFVGSLGVSNMTGLGFAPSGDLYATGGSGFYTVNPATGASSFISNISGFNSSGDLTYDAASGRFLATSTNGATDSLFSIGLAGDAQFVGNIGFNEVWGLFFNNGALYGYTGDQRQITINPTTGAGTFNQFVTGTSGQIGGAT